MTRRDELEQQLSARHVAPAIIERVLRLSALYLEGELLRGIYYTRYRSDPRLTHDCETKGDFIRKHGRDAWERVPAWGILGRGRRKYVTSRGAVEALAVQ